MHGRRGSSAVFWQREAFPALDQVQPIHVAAYVEALGKTHAPATVKLRLAGIRMLFDWLVTGQVVPVNPVAAVMGPRYVVRRGKTPVLAAMAFRV